MQTILAVDDDVATLELYKSIFNKLGYDVVSCDNPETAYTLVKQLSPECVLMDLCMPDIVNGLAATECIKSDPDTRDVPIVVVTGRTDDYTCIRVFDAGASDLVTKPFDAADIVKRVKPLITLSAARKLTSKIMNKF